MSYVVEWTNPVLGIKREITFETREEAQARVEHCARKYGQIAGYKVATIASYWKEP